MYKTVVIDPPWKKSTGGVGHASLQMSTHYEVQTKESIIQTVQEWFSHYGVAPECHMYMWAVNSFTAGTNQGILPTLDVCESLGFTPITLIPWVKSNVGSPTPYGMRYTEMCIFAVRYRKGMGKRTRYRGTTEPESVSNGAGLTSSKDYFLADRREHSRKPETFYNYVENRSKGPYLDLYSRTNRPGWQCVGKEAGLWTVK
jgi:N6-adenosine-specific RNA methylase IME4